MPRLGHIDARCILPASLFFSAGVLASQSWIALACYAFVALVSACAFRLSFPRLLGAIAPVFPLALFVLVAHAPQGFSDGAFSASKLLLLALCGAFLVLACAPERVSSALDFYLRPLSRAGLPAGDLSTMCSIALGSIPELRVQLSRIVAAQASRGASFHAGGPFMRLACWGRALLALFIASFRRAGVLADAMDSRCFGAGERSSLRSQGFGLAARALTALACTGLLALGLLL